MNLVLRDIVPLPLGFKMQMQTLSIKPRKPQQRAIDAAIKEGSPVPIAKVPFSVQVPSYGVEDVLSAVETNNQKVLGFIARLINTEVYSTIRAQLNDDELFPNDQEVDTANFDMEALTLDKLSEATVKTTALDVEFSPEQFAEFVKDFTDTLLPQFSNVRGAEVKILNTANILINGFKDIRNEPEKMEKVKGTLDKFMEAATDDVIDKYSEMYDYFVAMQDKRMKAFNRRQEKTDVFLD